MLDDFGCPSWMVLDRFDVADAAARVATALKQIRDQSAPPSAAVIGDVLDLLGGSAVPQRDLVVSIPERDAEADARHRAACLVALRRELVLC